jgi:L-alanine-DL-glutamate epimerase-like enolase superfamily enzyme
MASPTTIRHISVATLDIPLAEPFGIAGGAQDIARNLLVTLELADGTRGYGEAAPFPVFNGETQDGTYEAISRAAGLIEGGDPREWRRIAVALSEAAGSVGSARCALETALLDAFTRHLRLPLWAFFGGASTELLTDMTVTTGTAEQARRAALAIAARGIRTIKIKVGGGQVARDVERVRVIHETAPDCALFLDGNGGLSADHALELVAVLRDQGVPLMLLEQPVPRDDLAGMIQLATWAGVPVAADESLASARDALRLWKNRAAQIFNIKLMKCGIVEALDIVAIARASGIGLMIGGMVESILAMTVSACFAAGHGGFSVVDLDTPLFLAKNPFEGGMIYDGDRLLLGHISAGHGVTPRE